MLLNFGLHFWCGRDAIGIAAGVHGLDHFCGAAIPKAQANNEMFDAFFFREVEATAEERIAIQGSPKRVNGILRLFASRSDWADSAFVLSAKHHRIRVEHRREYGIEQKIFQVHCPPGSVRAVAGYSE